VVEITTFRADVYPGHSRKPVVEFGDTLEGDLVRRDFTVNAMAVDVDGLSFVDPYGGLQALATGALDTPSTPEQSFSDDRRGRGWIWWCGPGWPTRCCPS
jgi:poly(A) polymerase